MENNIDKICIVCGATEDEKIIKMVHGVYMCSKHKAQYYRYGKIIDKTKRTSQDENEIIYHNDYAELIIYSINNTEKYISLIDLDDIEKIKKRKWRIEFKEGRNHGYIVSGNTKKGRIYLHRFVLNYYGDLQVDHINRNKLDNRKSNLRIVSVIQNNHNVEIKRNNIEKHTKDTWRIRTIRYKREFLFGPYNTQEEALYIRDKFTKLLNKYEKELTEIYYKEKSENYKNINNVKSLSFIYEGKLYKTKMCKTIEEALSIRDDTKFLLEKYKLLA